MLKNFSNFYSNYIDTLSKSAIGIETTYRCPLQCPFCRRNREGGDIQISMAKDMPLDDLKKLTSFFRFINFCGEISDPIYHPNFYDLLEHVVGQNKSCTINTNGTRKKREWWEKVFTLCSGKPVKFTFGLDGADQETANIYRVNTRYDEVISVMKLGVEMGVTIDWQFIVFKHNEHQIDDAVKIAKEIGVNLKFVKSTKWDEKLIKITGIQKPSEKWVSNDGDNIKVFVK